VREERAVKYFKKGYNCTQAVIYVFSAEMGLDPSVAIKIAAPFGGGMGKTGSTCGAVSGALMVIGLKYGSNQVGDKKTQAKTSELSEKFIEKFKKRNGTIICKDLIGIDPKSRGIREIMIMNSKCPKFVRDAVEILEEIIRENG